MAKRKQRKIMTRRSYLYLAALVISIPIFTIIFLATPNEPMLNDQSTNSGLAPTPVNDATIKFDVVKAKVGDKVGTMTITRLNGWKAEKPTYSNAGAGFKGQVTITGDVFYNDPESYGGENVCINNLDDNSLSKMPKMTSETVKNIFICFSNTEYAKSLLGTNLIEGPQGRKTVIIDNYSISFFPVDSYGERAVLISITN